MSAYYQQMAAPQRHNSNPTYYEYRSPPHHHHQSNSFSPSAAAPTVAAAPSPFRHKSPTRIEGFSTNDKLMPNGGVGITTPMRGGGGGVVGGGPLAHTAPRLQYGGVGGGGRGGLGGYYLPMPSAYSRYAPNNGTNRELLTNPQVRPNSHYAPLPPNAGNAGANAALPPEDASAIDDYDYETYQRDPDLFFADGDDDVGTPPAMGDDDDSTTVTVAVNRSHFASVPERYDGPSAGGRRGGNNPNISPYLANYHFGGLHKLSTSAFLSHRQRRQMIRKNLAKAAAERGGGGARGSRGLWRSKEGGPLFDTTSYDRSADADLYAHEDFPVSAARPILSLDAILFICGLMESQKLNPMADVNHYEMAMHHRAEEQFLRDLAKGMQAGDYVTRYHLLRRADVRMGGAACPDPLERFIQLHIEHPSDSYHAHVDANREFPIPYLLVKKNSSHSSEVISRHRLCDLVGVTRDTGNPSFAPHRVFTDGSVGTSSVIFEDMPDCPDPDNCTIEQQSNYKHRQMAVLAALRAKVVGMQGKRYATTLKHQLLHGDNAFTLWFYEPTRDAAQQVVFCGHSAQSTTFWVNIFKGIIAVNSSRKLPIPVVTPYNNGGTLGRGAAELSLYQHIAAAEERSFAAVRGGAADGTAVVNRISDYSLRYDDRLQKKHDHGMSSPQHQQLRIANNNAASADNANPNNISAISHRSDGGGGGAAVNNNSMAAPQQQQQQQQQQRYHRTPHMLSPQQRGNDNAQELQQAASNNNDNDAVGLNSTPSASNANRQQQQQQQPPSAQQQQQQATSEKEKEAAAAQRTKEAYHAMLAQQAADRKRAEAEAKTLKTIRDNEDRMMGHLYQPRVIMYNARGEGIAEDGLTDAERAQIRSQRPPMAYLFRRCRYLIDLGNAQTRFFEGLHSKHQFYQ